MTQPSTTLFPANIAGAIQDLSNPEKITGQAFSYPESIIRILGAWNLFRVTRSTTQPGSPDPWDFWLKPAILSGTTITPAEAYTWNGTAWVDIQPGHLLAQLARNASANSIPVTGSGGAGGGVSFSASASPPTSPVPGQAWFSTSEEILYMRVSDGTNAFWLDLSSFGAGGSGGSSSGSTVSAGSTAPSSPVVGQLWYDQDDEILYMFTPTGAGNVWLDISSAGSVNITGQTAIDTVVAADQILIWDVSTNSLRKATIAQITEGVSASDYAHKQMFFFGSR